MGESDDMNEDFYASEQGEPIENRERVMKDLFNTEERISLLRHNWRGDVRVRRLLDGEYKYIWEKQYNRELAGDRFINTQMAALRSICNPTNAISRKSPQECIVILHDATEAFIIDLLNEPTVDKKHYRTLAKSFEHTIELFLGLTQNGHGARVLNNALAGLHVQEEQKEQKRSWFG